MPSTAANFATRLFTTHYHNFVGFCKLLCFRHLQGEKKVWCSFFYIRHNFFHMGHGFSYIPCFLTASKRTAVRKGCGNHRSGSSTRWCTYILYEYGLSNAPRTQPPRITNANHSRSDCEPFSFRNVRLSKRTLSQIYTLFLWKFERKTEFYAKI